MKLHTRDQAPKEGQQPAEKPVSKWEPGREEYLQFLVDSRHRPPTAPNPNPHPRTRTRTPNPNPHSEPEP
jgi:heme oxygenase